MSKENAFIEDRKKAEERMRQEEKAEENAYEKAEKMTEEEIKQEIKTWETYRGKSPEEGKEVGEREIKVLEAALKMKREELPRNLTIQLKDLHTRRLIKDARDYYHQARYTKGIIVALEHEQMQRKLLQEMVDLEVAAVIPFKLIRKAKEVLGR